MYHLDQYRYSSHGLLTDPGLPYARWRGNFTDIKRSALWLTRLKVQSNSAEFV
uniref:Uncharacterized protein n=1 Tax=Anguilla anguilla TaxID=7936 RepID=A0A0E9XNQ1_ANGAN